MGSTQYECAPFKSQKLDQNYLKKYQIEAEAVSFIAACYGTHLSNCKTMTECRQKQWAHITGKGNATAPKLCSLPPTTESFVENVKLAHHQTAQWKTALTGDPPSIDARNYGYEEDLHNKMLFPLNMSPGTPYAPDYILKLIRCSCGSTGAANPCKGSNCSCAGNQIPCTR